MIYPEISINELIAKLDSEDFYKEYGNPVSVTDTKDGYSLLLETEVYDYLNQLALKDYGVSLEELTNNYFTWIAACPEEFREWVEQNDMERGKKNDN